MSKSIYTHHLSELSNANTHYLNRLIKLLNYLISYEPESKMDGIHCHHIVPRSWKPEWSKEPDNLLKVTAKAHYIIHHLMWKAFPSCPKMIYAFHRMTSSNGERITSRVYERFMQAYSQNHSQQMSGRRLNLSDEQRQKISQRKVRYWSDPTNREKMIGDNNPNRRNPVSDETKRKLSLYRGDKSSMFGKHLSDEAKRKISEANTGNRHTEEVKQASSLRNTGRCGVLDIYDLTTKQVSVEVYTANKDRYFTTQSKTYRDWKQGLIPVRDQT